MKTEKEIRKQIQDLKDILDHLPHKDRNNKALQDIYRELIVLRWVLT